MRSRGIDVAAELPDSLPDPVIGCDVDGTVVYWSRAAEDLYGYPAAEALGRRAAMLLRTRFPAPQLEITEELGDVGSWRGRVEHRCRDGRTVVVDSRWVARRDATGALAGSFAVERELDEATAPPASEREREHLQPGDPTARELAHELNNALAVIVNYSAFVAAELGSTPAASGEAMRADLHEVQAAADRALEVTRRLAGEL